MESERDCIPRRISSYTTRQIDRVRFLITAGPTREPIDPVRYISNRSSGKMGYAIAEAALDAGHDVILISGPVNLRPPRNAQFISVSTSDEMFVAVHRHSVDSDVCVLCAAVADYKPAEVSPVKIKKRAGRMSLELIPTRDILASLGECEHRQFLLVGFAAETDHVEQNGAKKLREKHCDIIVANDARVGMESDENELLVLCRDGETQTFSRAPKKILAHELVKIFLNSQQKRLTKKM
jgi:phosphopantothenoylcysteine decarboxylase / phosphopantothenate---cysteine ligase